MFKSLMNKNCLMCFLVILLGIALFLIYEFAIKADTTKSMKEKQDVMMITMYVYGVILIVGGGLCMIKCRK